MAAYPPLVVLVVQASEIPVQTALLLAAAEEKGHRDARWAAAVFHKARARVGTKKQVRVVGAHHDVLVCGHPGLLA